MKSLLIEVDGPRREVAETVPLVGDVGVDEVAQGDAPVGGAELAGLDLAEDLADLPLRPR